MHTCEADPRGLRVEWRDRGGRTRLVGVTELGRMVGNDPNLAVSVLYGWGRWEAGRSGGGMDPQRKGWVRVEEGGGGTSNSSSSSSTTLNDVFDALMVIVGELILKWERLDTRATTGSFRPRHETAQQILLPSARHLKEGRGTTILELLRQKKLHEQVVP